MSTLNLKPDFTVAYAGKMFEIITWEGKPGVQFEAAARSPGVRLLIECDKNGEKALLLSREIRREATGIDFRLPGGKVFDHLDEYNNYRRNGSDITPAAEAAAVKEAREEAGARGGTVRLLGVSKAGASVEWDLYYFLLTGSDIGEQELEDSERDDITALEKLTGPELFEKLTTGQVQEGRSAEVLWRWLAENKLIKLA